MTEPPRIDRLSDDARAMLDAYRRSTPGEERRRANLGAVKDRVAEQVPPRAAAAAGLAWPIGWGVASAVAAAGLVWGLIELRAPPPPQPPSQPPVEVQPAAPAPSPPTREVAPDPVTPAVADEPPSPPSQRPSARAERTEPTPVPSASDLREETRMLRSVRASISTGALDQAADTLAKYTVAFPNGALREDAQAYRVIVACKRGDDVGALRSAFAQRYPGSPHVARIDAACGGAEK